MKRSEKPLFPQMNLPFSRGSEKENLDDQHKDLIVALMELLVSAAAGKDEKPRSGGEDEPETHA